MDQSITATELLSILAVARRLAEQRMLQPLMAYVATTVFELVAAERCLIVLFGDGGALDVQLARTRQGAPIIDAQDQLSRSILQRVRTTMAPLLIGDAVTDQAFQASKSVQALGLRSVVCVPLLAHERCVGAIYVENRSLRATFREESLVPLVLFSHQVVAALESARINDTLSRTNAELARALRLKDEFLTTISHELRTPLSTILGVTEALDEEIYGPLTESQRAALATVSRSGRHLLHLIGDMLDLAHIAAGNAMMDWQAIDLEILCRSALQFVQAPAQQKGLRLVQRVQPDITRLLADERRLTKILVNLLDNAVKFTPAGGEVGLEVVGDVAQERVELCVWDTGIGIAEADMGRLFQPFTQVEGRLDRPYGGLGLGLALMRRLVQLHGGGVRLESAPGQGSRFTVSLPWPAARDAALSLAPEPGLFAHPSARSPFVMLVSDDERLLHWYAEPLIRQGCQVVTARSGEELVSMLRANHPDVIALSADMFELKGPAAIRDIRELCAGADVALIVLSALDLPGDHERYLAAGANRHLVTPVSPRVLAATIAGLLRLSSVSVGPSAG